MREIRQYFEINSKNKAFQNLWHIGKAVFRMMPTALNTCIRKEDRYKIFDPSFHFNKSEKEQTKSKVSKWKKITKTKAGYLTRSTKLINL